MDSRDLVNCIVFLQLFAPNFIPLYYHLVVLAGIFLGRLKRSGFVAEVLSKQFELESVGILSIERDVSWSGETVVDVGIF